MNNFLNEYFGFYFELNIELNHFLARFNEKMNIQNVSARATLEFRWYRKYINNGYIGHRRFIADIIVSTDGQSHTEE